MNTDNNDMETYYSLLLLLSIATTILIVRDTDIADSYISCRTTRRALIYSEAIRAHK